MNAINSESAHPVAPPGVSDSFPAFPDALAGGSVFACPQCNDTSTALVRAAGCFLCGSCDTQFPIVCCNGCEVPWLFAEPEAAFAQWYDRYLRMQLELDGEIAGIEKGLQRVKHPASRRRLQHLLGGKQQFKLAVEHMLAPFWTHSSELQKTATSASAARVRLPHNQTIASYQANIFRDWAWGKAEMEEAFAAVARVMSDARVSDLGRFLTIGAGPGALPYLLEQRYKLDWSLKFDINPLFAGVNTAMMADRQLELVEFPTAPVDARSYAVLRTCERAHLDQEAGGMEDVCTFERSTAQNKSGYTLGDIKHMPFVDAAFDTVFTPWLIDLLPGKLDTFLSTLNRLLPAGGVWLNTGSLNFSSADPVLNLSREELLERIAFFGFAVKSQDVARLPYLQSPASAHHRVEQVFSFCAVKTHEVERVNNAHSIHTMPLAGDLDTQFNASNYLLKAQVLGAINGTRTVDDIAHAIAQKYDLEASAARRIVVGIIEQEHLRH